MTTLDDLLIHYSKCFAETLFGGYDYHSEGSIHLLTQSSLVKVVTLFDSYLAEVTPDANLSLGLWVSLLLLQISCQNADVIDDGLYRVVDIYLKVCSAF